MQISENKKEVDFVKIDVNVIHMLRNLGVKNGNEVMLFGKILSLSTNQNGACTAGNAYLANVLGVTERSIQDYIRDLKKVGAIKTFEKKIGCKTTTRFIYPQKLSEISHEESCTQYDEDTKTCVSTTRRITSDHTKDHVEGHEESRQTTRRGLHPIIEEREIDINRKDIDIDKKDIPLITSLLKTKENEYNLSIDFNGGLCNEDMPHIIKSLIIENLDDYENINELINKVIEICTDYPYYCENKDGLNDCIEYFIEPIRHY